MSDSKLINLGHLRITAEEIEAYLAEFRKGDLFDPDFRHRLINTFINCIYLFDDKLVIYYNARQMKEVSYIEMLDDTAAPTSDSSDSFVNGPPKNSENGVLGIFLYKAYI